MKKMRNSENMIATQIRMDESDYNKLKKLAYLRDISINRLMVEGIKEFLEKDKKLLLNADIVLS